MAKLYPPYLEGVLPCFALDINGDGNLTIPFAYNKAVAKKDVISAAIKFKTVQNDVLLFSARLDELDGSINEESKVVIPVQKFQLKEANNFSFSIGQFYKVQMAFIDTTGTVGYYSTVGVIKCSSKPKVFIENFSESKVNNNKNQFVGVFEQQKGGDTTEKVYSSQFIIRDTDNNVIFQTDEVLHNTQENPDSYTSYDEILFNRDLEFGKIYNIEYIVKTNNGLVARSPRYLLTQQKSLRMDLKGKLVATLNYEEGFVDVSIDGYRDEAGNEEIAGGMFLLSREDKLNPNTWEELCRFSLNHEYPSRTVFRDFTIEQGKTYTYCLQQYNSYDLYSDRKRSNAIYADFEDMFLFDGKRQLKLRFNPKVSNFKTQLAESKIDTIGSKYPTFFRNAAIGYKTFPISALLSMLTDDNKFFTSWESILRADMSGDRHGQMVQEEPYAYDYTDLNSYNYASERLFKLSVLDWVNDGKVKLFKSPGEGNYLVRLMESSLTPTDSLGRMLHTLNSTAYETAECVHSELVKYDIIDAGEAEENLLAIAQWNESSLVGTSFSGPYSGNLLPDGVSSSDIRLTDLMPGTRVQLVFSNGGKADSIDSMTITIGATGQYRADNIRPVHGIYVLSPNGGNAFTFNSGTVSYQYEVPSARDNFNAIKSIETDIGAYAQLVGETDDVVKACENPRDQITKISMANIEKRPVEYLYYNGDYTEGSTLYWDNEYQPIDVYSHEENKAYSPFAIYVLRPLPNRPEGDKNIPSNMFAKFYADRIENADSAEDRLIAYRAAKIKAEGNEELDEYLKENPLLVLDGYSNTLYKGDYNYDPSIEYNGENINFTNIDTYSLENIEPADEKLKLGNGVKADIFYQKVSLAYSFEEDLPERKAWMAQQKVVDDLKRNKYDNGYDKKLSDAVAKLDELYDAYTVALGEAIEEWSARKEN